jgi:hypothetical protein
VSPIYLPVGVAALLAGVAAAVCKRWTASKDRQRIREDLQTRRCRFVAARRALKSPGSAGGRSYDVEFVDPEDDPALTSCNISRTGIVWGDDSPAPGSHKLVMAGELPTYGQNWRG